MNSKEKRQKFETQQNYYQLSSIQLGGGNWSMPVMGAGISVYLKFGFGLSLFSIFFGYLLILIGYYYFVKMSAEGRLNAVENLERYFGKTVGRFFAFVILVTMIGWLAVGLERMAQGLELLSFDSRGVKIQTIVGCSAAIVLFFGVRGLRILTSFLAPALFIILLICFLLVGTEYGYSLEKVEPGGLFRLAGILPIIIVLLDSIIEYPTFYQHSRSLWHSIFSLLIIFLGTCIGSVLVIYIGQGREESMVALINSDMFNHPLLRLLSIVFLILSTLGISSWNIYAASIGWESLLKKYKNRTEYILIGFAAVILVEALPVDYVLEHIVEIGAIPIISAMISILINYLMISHEMERIEITDHHGKTHTRETMPRPVMVLNNLSWIFGTIIGVLSRFVMWFNGIDPLIISFIVAGASTFVFIMIWEVFRRIKLRH